MKLVKHLLESKGHEVLSIAPDATVLDAIRMMEEQSIGALVVFEDSKLAGMITERDYARKVILKGRASEDTSVSEIMTRNVVTVDSNTNIQQCMELMTDKRIRHLPVVDGDAVSGLISIGDLVKAIIADQREEIEQLGQYIRG
ncbi:MAG: CBS domain-containing protein [Woeseiaceae bacterium]|nr:CBS domain-containing protein [Woeseiaceae bacterium]